MCAERELRKAEGELGEFDCSEGVKEEGLSAKLGGGVSEVEGQVEEEEEEVEDEHEYG